MKSQLTELETVLKAFADGTRLRILGLLTTGEVCVCDIQDSLKIPQPKASRHLAYLRRAGIVTTRRDGLWVHYGLAPGVDPLVTTIQQAITHAVGHIDTVKKDIERLQRSTGCCAPSVPGSPSYACCERGGRETAR
ncbi:MAG: winged helix-turn-helix transcriptional regulator [Acidimicrobiia bacterium]|nr:winged helix-turn-helix transcriptional regulator [Acidimicrobiia bacterium]